jgi:flagellar protein FliO/FliZ
MSLRRPIGVPSLRTWLLLGLVVLGLVPAVPAAEDNKVFTPVASRSEAPANAAGASMGSVSLFLGLALAGAGGWLLWRNRRATPIGRDQRALAIDETRSLGNRQFLVVASYEGKKFLLGVCPGRIDLLSPLDGVPAKERTRE